MAKAAKMRVPIPRNPFDKLTLAGKIYARHQSLGADSQVKTLEDFNWDTEGPKIDQALQYHNDAEKLKLQMEKAYRERDLLLEGIDGATKASRDVLTGVYRKNMKRMGEWGFTVDDTPKAKPAPKQP